MIICQFCGKEKPTSVQSEHIGAGTCAQCAETLCRKITPPIFMETDMARLSPRLQEAVRKWRPEKGIVFIGPSGSCKTRAMWEIVKKRIDLHPIVFSPGPNSFGSQLADAYRREGDIDFIKKVSSARLVAFDDVTKLKMTERVEAELFGIIDHRICHKLPIIATMQDGSGVSESMSADRSGPLLRRLREFCDVVEP